MRHSVENSLTWALLMAAFTTEHMLESDAGPFWPQYLQKVGHGKEVISAQVFC